MKYKRLTVFLVVSLLLLSTVVTLSQQYNLPRQYSATQGSNNWFFISGNVGDNSNKSALAGVTVTARNDSGALFSAVTDTSGNYAIELPRIGGYNVSFKKAGYVPQWWAGEFGSQLEWDATQVFVGTEYDRPDSVAGISTSLDRCGVIRGRASRYGQGTPATIYVHSVYVQSVKELLLVKNQHIKKGIKSVPPKMDVGFDVGAGPVLFASRTGENGLYQVPVVPGNYFVEFIPDTLPCLQWYNHKFGPPYDTVKVVAIDDTARNINADFTPGRTTIAGRVTDTSGTPLVCKVVAYNWNDEDVLQVWSTLSNANGYYNLPVPIGMYKVGFIKSKYIQAWWAGGIDQAYVPMNACSVAVGEMYQVPDSIANINGYIVRGAVVYGHTTLYNEPVVSDVLVTNSEVEESGSWHFYTRSNKNGDFEMALPEGKWFMMFLRRGSNTTGPFDRRTIWYNQKVETPYDTLIITSINDSLKNINAEFGLPPEMQAVRILSIKDVPNDQGKQVSVIWKALQRTVFGADNLIQTQLMLSTRVEVDYPIITAYSVLRRDGLVWTQVARLDPQLDSIYSAVVPTLFDSTKSAGIFWSKFKVTAHTIFAQPFYSSIRDSGYSVDNIVPIIPQGINASIKGDNLVIAWNSPPTEDVVVEYLVYRSTIRNFSIEGLTEHAKVKTTSYEDVGAASATYYYKVVAVDPSGNKSNPSAEVTKSGTGVENANIKPTVFELYQNYPNPFNPSTSITYDLPDERYVSLKIYNTLGQEVASLVNATQSIGRYTINFDARNLASGLYIYRLTAGTSVSIMKMLLVK